MDGVTLTDGLHDALQELITVISLPPPASASGHAFPALRASFAGRAAACAREAARFALVLRTSPCALASLQSAVAHCGEAAAHFTTAAQALRAAAMRGGGGATFSGDLAPLAAGLLLALAQLAQCASRELRDAPGGLSLAHPDALLPGVAMVEHWAEDGLRRLPTTPAAAVRRRLLSAAQVVRRSATDVREETAVAVGQAPPPPAASAVADTGVAALRALSALIQASLAVVDAAPVIAASGEAADDAASLSEALAHASLARVGNACPLDAIAAAAAAVDDSVIDFAAAVSNASEALRGGGEEEEEEEDEEGEGEGGADGDEAAEVQASSQSVRDTAIALRAAAERVLSELIPPNAADALKASLEAASATLSRALTDAAAATVLT